jgi:AcrR family transcriptional regulator
LLVDPQMTIADIVSSAAVSQTVFYEHFHDKQQVALAMFEHGFELTMMNAARAFFAQDSWPERIWACARALCEAHATHPALLHGCFVEYATMGPAAVQLTHHRLMAFTLLLEDGYRQRPQAEGLRLWCVVVSAPGEIRNRDRWLRRPTLYPAELRAQSPPV